MNNIQKRFLLFLFGCISVRLLLVLIAKNIDKKYLQIMGIFTMLPAIGFIYIYLTGGRKTGGEVFGSNIWWNDLRPVHGALYLIFSLNAINQNKNSWIYLLIDVLIGLFSFFIYHISSGNIYKLL